MPPLTAEGSIFLAAVGRCLFRHPRRRLDRIAYRSRLTRFDFAPWLLFSGLLLLLLKPSSWLLAPCPPHLTPRLLRSDDCLDERLKRDDIPNGKWRHWFFERLLDWLVAMKALETE